MMVSSGVETVQSSFIILSQVTTMISLCFFIQHVKVCSLRGNRFSSFVSSTWYFSVLSPINHAALQWVSLGAILSRCGRRLTVNELWALCYTCLSSLQSYIDFPGDCDTCNWCICHVCPQLICVLSISLSVSGHGACGL